MKTVGDPESDWLLCWVLSLSQSDAGSPTMSIVTPLQAHPTSHTTSLASPTFYSNDHSTVRKSRAIQTQLTRDDFNDDFDENSGIPTNVDFSLHMPDLLGAEVDPVETHYVEPSEPVDVRKNRELTLTNMRLQREVERLKLQIGDGEALKKEARTAKCKLEEERKARLRIEAELDRHV